MLNKFQKLIRRVPEIELFIKSNKSHQKNITKGDAVALFELQVNYPAYIGYSYFARVLESQGVNLIGYRPVNDLSKWSHLTFNILRTIPLDNGVNWPFRIMRSFGVTKFILPSRESVNKLNLDELFLEFTSLNKLKKLQFKINDVLVGDLFYDWHLRQRGLSTITEDYQLLRADFSQFFETFMWWENYFICNKVDSVFVSHSVYSQGILARIGMKFNSKVFLVGADRVYRLTLKELHPDMEFLSYKPAAQKQFGYLIDLERAKNAIKTLRRGNQSLSTAHSYVSGYKGRQDRKVIEQNGKINVLIASHCFSDSPHATGDFLFADFEEWLNFLGHKSSQTLDKYNWYIKAHPAFFDTDKIHFTRIIANFPWIQPISSDFSNLDLFEQGVQVVLTIYGTIAFEAAYEGVLVINASSNSPHTNYEFSLRPNSISEYEAMIDAIPNFLNEFVINQDEILHFYDLHHLRKNSNIYFREDYLNLLSLVGGYNAVFTSPEVLGYWVKRIHEKKLDETFLSEFLAFYGGVNYFMFSDE